MLSNASYAAFSNYNSTLLGERAAGMGAAFTALSGDSAACSFYNPATVARMESSTLSASVSLYNKYETRFGNQDDFSSAPLRVNQGSIVPLPSSSGSILNYGNFALAISILIPDFDLYTGEVRSTQDSSSYINFRDESLWIGGTLALNLSKTTSVGLSMYYTSRRLNRTVTDQYTSGGETTLINEEKIFSNNSVVYILGFYQRLSQHLNIGFSARLPSIEINGRGSYFRSAVSTDGSLPESINETNLESETRIPARYSVGIAYEKKQQYTYSVDVSYYAAHSYSDMNLKEAADFIDHRQVYNVNLGYETYLKTWLALRLGLFTDTSSHNSIPDNSNRRLGDHVNRWGWSANVALITSEQSIVTLGGYYNGGKGHSTQQIADNIEKVQKSQQLFSFLVGTSFRF